MGDLKRYRVVLVARELRMAEKDLTGFVTTRFVTTNHLESAKALATQLVEESAKEDFEEDQDLTISVIDAWVVRNPFKKSVPNGGYTFFDCEEAIEEALLIENTAGSSWFEIHATT